MYVFILYFITALLSLKFINEQSPSTKKISILVFSIIGLLLIFRFNTTGDISTYLKIYNRVENPIKESLMYDSHRNVGFVSLIHLTKLIWFDFRFFTIIFNIIVIGLCFYTIYKESKSLVISLMLFIGSGIMEVYFCSGLKQMMAMSIFFFSYFKFLLNKNYFKYYVFSIISCTFHEVALVTLIIPLLVVIEPILYKNENKNLIITFSSAIFFMFVFSPIVTYLSQLYVGNSYFTYILKYMTYYDISYVGIMLRIIITILIYFIYKVSNTTDTKLRTQVYTCMFSCVIYLMLGKYSLVARVSDFIEIISLVTIANLIMLINNRQLKVVILLFTFMLNLLLLTNDVDFQRFGIIKNTITGKDNNICDYRYIHVFSNEAHEFVYKD